MLIPKWCNQGSRKTHLCCRRLTVNYIRGIALAEGYNLARWPIFKNVSILEYLVSFWAFFFCTEQLWCSCRMVFRIFLVFLFFDPNWAFWKGHSLCMGCSPCEMANLQNCLISPIFGVLSRPYLHRTTLIYLHEYYVNCRHTNEMKMWSSHVRSSHNIHIFHSFHGYDKFNKSASSQRMRLHSSVGGALQR